MKKRSFYQIWLPLIVSIILIGYVFFILMSSINGDSTAFSQWSDISMIYMLSPIIGITLIVLILSIAVIFLISQLRSKTKTGLQSLQQITQQIKGKTANSCTNIVSFFFIPSAWLNYFRGVQKKDE